jgi:hypothetical protein
MNKMSKSEVYSWRVTPALKAQLEAAAREEKTSVALLLERMARDWLEAHMPDDAEEQRRLHRRARAAIGTVSVGGPSATNANVRAVMGEILEKKYRASQRRAPRRSN